MSDEARELLLREFPVEVSEGGDGRTLEARIVPYNTPARVVDKIENGGTGVPYMETWAPGAFDRQSGALNRVKVWLNFEHEPGFRGIVGHGEALDSRSDGLYGTFRIHDNADGNKALRMVQDGLLTGISLEAFSIRHRRTAEGVVERIRGHLDRVSLCRLSKAAFEGAAVLALREEPAPDPDPDPDEPAPEPTPDEPDSQRMSPQDVREEIAAEEAAKNPPEFSEAELALQRVGYEPLTVTVVRQPWNPDAARFTDEEYERACLVDRGGELAVKERCSLLILEPNGDVNANALKPAADVLSGTRAGLRGVSGADKANAARKLIRYYAQADMDPPDGLRRVAAS